MPEDEVTYSLTIDPSYNLNFLAIVPWVKLSLPDCVSFKDQQRLAINDDVLGSAVVFQLFSPLEVVFQLRQGFNKYTLSNLINPSTKCLLNSKRISFEYRTF